MAACAVPLVTTNNAAAATATTAVNGAAFRLMRRAEGGEVTVLRCIGRVLYAGRRNTAKTFCSKLKLARKTWTWTDSGRGGGDCRRLARTVEVSESESAYSH